MIAVSSRTMLPTGPCPYPPRPLTSEKKTTDDELSRDSASYGFGWCVCVCDWSCPLLINIPPTYNSTHFRFFFGGSGGSSAASIASSKTFFRPFCNVNSTGQITQSTKCLTASPLSHLSLKLSLSISHALSSITPSPQTWPLYISRPLLYHTFPSNSASIPHTLSSITPSPQTASLLQNRKFLGEQLLCFSLR